MQAKRKLTALLLSLCMVLGMLPMTVFAAGAELEREYILQRQREGIAIVKQQGKYRGRPPKVYPDFERIAARWQKGEITAVQAMKQLGMSKTRFYERVKRLKK